METITAFKRSNSTHREGVGKFIKKLSVFFIKENVVKSTVGKLGLTLRD